MFVSSRQAVATSLWHKEFWLLVHMFQIVAGICKYFSLATSGFSRMIQAEFGWRRILAVVGIAKIVTRSANPFVSGAQIRPVSGFPEFNLRLYSLSPENLRLRVVPGAPYHCMSASYKRASVLGSVVGIGLFWRGVLQSLSLEMYKKLAAGCGHLDQ